MMLMIQLMLIYPCMVLMNLKTNQFIKDNGKKARDTEREFNIGMMGQYTRVIGKITLQMAAVD